MNICLYKIWVTCLIKHTAVSTKVMKGTQKVCGPPYSASIFMHPIGFLNLPFKTMTFWDWQLNESFSSVQNSVMSDSLQPQESQCARPPCPSPTPRVYLNSCPSSLWCHPAISSSVVPFSSCPQSLPASVFSNESTLHMRWPKYWSFSFSIIPSKEHPGLMSFRMDWLDLLAVQGTLKSLLQHHSSQASILQRSAFFTVQLSHPYILEKP